MKRFLWHISAEVRKKIKRWLLRFLYSNEQLVVKKWSNEFYILFCVVSASWFEPDSSFLALTSLKGKVSALRLTKVTTEILRSSFWGKSLSKGIFARQPVILKTLSKFLKIL